MRGPSFKHVTGSVESTELSIGPPKMTDPYLHTSLLPLVLQVKKDLERHEGYRYYAYPDPLSKLFNKYRGLDWGFKPARELLALIKDMGEADGRPWTVGFGFTHGVTPDSTMEKLQAERKLEQEILEVYDSLVKALPWFKDASFVTKTILINMTFNMGLRGVLGFRNTLRFISEKNYEQAARNMEQSLWYRQVGARASELVERMRTQTIKAAHKAKETL